MNSFYIKSITVGEHCNKALYKTLHHETYKLAEKMSYDWYGKNISISAVVGENGAGKSSLLDILYRIINNFSYLVIAKNKKRRAAEPLYFIPDLYASIEYVINEKECKIECQGESVGIIRGNIKWYFTNLHKKVPFFEKKQFEYKAQLSSDSLRELLKDCFFTIATNYSLQAFNSSDYAKDNAHSYVDGTNNQGYRSDGNWMDSIFNKNDGYLVPITINPYRNHGVFDLNNETERTEDRLASLLLFFKKKSLELLTDYQLKTIEYDFDNYAIGERLNRHRPKSDEGTSVRDPLDLHLRLRPLLEDCNNFLNIILRELGFGYMDDEIGSHACIYLGYKILSIAGKYPSYQDYVSIGDPWNLFRNADDNEQKLLCELIEIIEKDYSHITTKVHQTISFLRAHQAKGTKIFDGTFTFEQYENYVGGMKNRSVEGYIKILPPPIFRSHIYMYKTLNKGEVITIDSLSSGERQFLYTISTLIYHIINIKSVPSRREHYRNINIVMDEIEICFHPEYQRNIVNWLVTLIKRLQFNRYCAFNIIMTTHSPFILSDIVPQNILYLEDGEATTIDLKTPFAANVNDILRQSFFLKNGFMGEFAKQKVLSLIKYLTTENPQSGYWTNDKANACIELIGEPMLSEKLEELQSDR